MLLANLIISSTILAILLALLLVGAVSFSRKRQALRQVQQTLAHKSGGSGDLGDLIVAAAKRRQQRARAESAGDGLESSGQ